MTELELEQQQEEETGGHGGQVEFRKAQIGDVSFPERTIDLIVMPYETPTLVRFGGRMVQEIVSRGAFGNVQQRSGGRLKVNRDHNPSRPVGRVKALYPNRDDGLIAKLLISRTVEGEETLVLAEDGILDASAGFGLLHDKQTGKVKTDAEVWETRDRRRLNHLWLDHVAMVSNPAYPTANVLSVRSQEQPEPPKGTPNLDQVRAWRLQDRYGSL